MRTTALLSVGALICTLPAFPQTKTLAEMEPIFQKVAAFEFGQARDPLWEVEEFVRGSMPSRERLDPIERRLLRLLESSATLAGKDFACRQLSLIGTGVAVPVLAAMLGKPQTAEMARYALQRIPSPRVDAALRDALVASAAATKIGIVNSLGERKDARAVGLLRPLAVSTDVPLAEAAGAALGRICGPDALETLATTRTKSPAAARFRISEGYLECAGKSGRASAVRAAKELMGPGEPPMIRVAALRLLASSAGSEAVPVLAKELNSSDAAIGALAAIPGAQATEALAAAYPKAPPGIQVRILTALAERSTSDLNRDREGAASSVRALAAQAVNAQTPELRAAGLWALGKTGDSSSVRLLAEAAATREGAEQTAARESLYALRGPAVDAEVVAGLRSGTGKTKVELIRAAGERGISSATDALLDAARDPDRDARRESLRALREMAAPRHAQALVEILTSSGNAADRREAGRTLASILKKSTPVSAAPAISAYQSATAAPVRAALIESIGLVASADALPVLRAGLKDGEREVSRAAILALSEWPTPEPMPDLLAVAKGDGNPAAQVLALRGYVRLAAIPADRPAAEGARMLAEALALAKQPEERRLVLAALPNYPSKESLALAESLLNDAAVGKEAKVAFDRLLRALNPRK